MQDVNLPMKSVTDYLLTCNKTLDEKAKNLYSEGYLKTLRMARETDGSCIYVKAQCCAEMKKRLHYNINSVIDKCNVVNECECDCAAGMGPAAHCKHICAVLFGLTEFSSKKVLILQKTCTEKLQTFHKPCRFRGSPQKTANLNLRNRYATSSIFKDAKFDPRPLKYRKMQNYPTYFQNTILNFSHLSPEMPILNTIPPANLYAFTHDHDYFEKSPQEICLNNLKVLVIIKEEIESIEAKTRGQASCAAWFAERRKRISSSNFSRICKATSHTDLEKLALSIINPVAFKSAATNYGVKYETVAVAKYDLTVQKTSDCGLFVCGDLPYLAATPDRIVNEDTVLEVKCPYSARSLVISPSTVPYLCLDPSGDLVLVKNHNYYYQSQGQLLCTGKNYCDFVVYTRVDMKIIKIARDNAFIEEMKLKLINFFENYFKCALLNVHVYKNTSEYAFKY